ncbi:MAG: DUF3006 domain-containing protein [Lachnospirales bacterium]
MLIIDRFEGNIAVCQDENLKIINLLDYPEGAKEGDCLDFIDGKYVINIEETNKRSENAKKLLNKLFNR